MSHAITYTDCGQRYRVAVECNRVQAGRIARLLPDGALVDETPVTWPREPERAALLAVLIVRSELQRIAGGAR